MHSLRVFWAVAMAACWLWPAAAEVNSSGRELFEKRCGGCHALDSTKAGPPLRAAFRRRAASDAAFPYSDALRKSGLVWDEATLERWLADPEVLVPNNDMAFRLMRTDERAAVISYLKQLSSERPADKRQPH